MVRTARPAQDVATEADLLAVAEPVRQAVRARLADRRDVDPDDAADDIVQETLARVWAERWRLERGTLLSYGLVVARNLVTSAERAEQVGRRHRPRLAEPEVAEDPVAELLAVEERTALTRALAALRAEDRRLLVEHELHGVEARKIAAERGVEANTVAARLARARARLRVEHLLALRRVTLPTARCRGVLDAISLGDRRRQRTLLAAEHLAGCATCAELAEPLLTRRRSLTALAPVLLLPLWLWRLVRSHPVPSSAVGAGAVAVAVAVAMSGSEPPPPPAAAPVAVPSPSSSSSPSPAPPATRVVAGVAMLPAGDPGALRAKVGEPAAARSVPVQSVPADEGFWVGAGPGHRVWVQLGTSSESGPRVRPGQHASFPARVVRVGPGTLAEIGLTAAEGAGELTRTGAYLVVDPSRLVLR